VDSVTTWVMVHLTCNAAHIEACLVAQTSTSFHDQHVEFAVSSTAQLPTSPMFAFVVLWRMTDPQQLSQGQIQPDRRHRLQHVYVSQLMLQPQHEFVFFACR
jgi:hypothetical protein